MINKENRLYILIVIILLAIFGTYFLFDKGDDLVGGLPKSIKEFTVVKEDISEAAIEKLQKQFDTQLQLLDESTPEDFEWNEAIHQIGIVKFAAEDYEGARDAWQYIYERNPNGYIVNGNLGNLYFYYLKEYELSEKHYLEALALTPIAPGNHYTYFSELLDLYQYGTEDNGKAEALIVRALNEIPSEVYDRMKSRAADYYSAIGELQKAEEIKALIRTEVDESPIEIISVEEL